MNRKRIAIILLLTLIIAAQSGCAGGNSSGPTDTIGPSETLPGTDMPSPDTEVDLDAFCTDMISKHNVEALMLGPYDRDIVDNYFPGLTDIPAKQLVAYGAVITMNTTEFVFIEVEDSGDVETVRAILQARIDEQVGTDDEPGDAWYPSAIEAWKNNSTVISHGNYVAMIVCKQYSGIAEDFNALF